MQQLSFVASACFLLLLVGCESGPLRERITRGQYPSESKWRKVFPMASRSTAEPVSADDFSRPKATVTSSQVDPLTELYTQAKRALVPIKSAQARVIRSDDSGEESALYQYRKEPYSIHIRCLDGASQGREVLYVAGKHQNKIHLLPAASDSLFGIKPIRMALDPDAPLLKSKCAHDLRDAGIEYPATQFGKALASNAKEMRLKHLAKSTPKVLGYLVEGVSCKLLPNEERILPHGGYREVYFDARGNSPTFGLPVWIRFLDPEGKELQSMRFEKLQINPRLTDADFDPAQMGK